MRYKLTRNNTVSISHKDVKKEWVLIDATGLVVGRLAAFLAHNLRGKSSVDYTPNVDCGQHIIVINCSKLAFTGKKYEDKMYYHHTGFSGGLKERTAKEVFNSADPCDILRLAVKRMLSKGPMAYKRLGNLYLFKDANHNKTNFNGKVVDFASMNVKNI
jgi:large subunit ribosomal protein L13